MINSVEERKKDGSEENSEKGDILFFIKELEMIYTIEEGKYLYKTRTTFDSTWRTISFGEQFMQELNMSKQTKYPLNLKIMKHYQLTVR